MRALICDAYGPIDQLQVRDVPVPEPGPGEVRIRVEAAAVNFPDALIVQGLYQVKPALPFSPGAELAGVVEAVGEGVRHVQPGQRVIGFCGHGAFAEQAVVSALQLMPLPDGMDMDTGAALVLTYGTSLHALQDCGRLQPGETLLVLGAAGGVGLAAVQLGKVMGLTVIAGASSQEKVDLCLAHGADAGIVYPRQPLDRAQQKALSEDIKAAGGGGVDIVYDAVGGDYAEPALRAMNWEGRYLVVGFPAGIPKLPLNLALLKGCDVLGVFWGDFVRRSPQHHQQNLKEMMELYAHGKIRPYVSESFPLDKARDAIDWLSERKAMGKVVVTMG